jgi:hypothetical protein
MRASGVISGRNRLRQIAVGARTMGPAAATREALAALALRRVALERRAGDRLAPRDE